MALSTDQTTAETSESTDFRVQLYASGMPGQDNGRSLWLDSIQETDIDTLPFTRNITVYFDDYEEHEDAIKIAMTTAEQLGWDIPLLARRNINNRSNKDSQRRDPKGVYIPVEPTDPNQRKRQFNVQVYAGKPRNSNAEGLAFIGQNRDKLIALRETF